MKYETHLYSTLEVFYKVMQWQYDNYAKNLGAYAFSQRLVF